MKNLLIANDFRDVWEKTNPGAHTGAKHLTVEDIEHIVNKAEIFALLTEHYIEYCSNSQKTGSDSNE